MPAQHLPREADHRDPSGVAHTSTKNPSALTFSLLRCMARAKTMREGASKARGSVRVSWVSVRGAEAGG